MKPVIVTATTAFKRAAPCLKSWGEAAPLVVVVNGGEPLPDCFSPKDGLTLLRSEQYLGSVPAFRAGVDYVLEHRPEADPIICLHDDVEIQEPEWLRKVCRLFEQHPECGLAGFGGAIGLGAEDIYKVPYNPMQLARIGFRSNLTDAEAHGVRSLLPERVACLDGFSQIGRRAFFEGRCGPMRAEFPGAFSTSPKNRPWTYLEDHGFVHHFYDGALGCLAARVGWETWYLPVRCRHLGGQTAVADRGYHEWAKGQIPGGDQGFWQQSHERGYELFRDVLPLRV